MALTACLWCQAPEVILCGVVLRRVERSERFFSCGVVLLPQVERW